MIFSSIVRNEGDVKKSGLVFKPDMAHQVFGETENIFGYKDLNINVYYSAGPLDIYYDVKHSKKVIIWNFHELLTNFVSIQVDDIPKNNGLKADNVNVITEYFPDGYYTNLEEFLTVMEKKAKTFEPAGEKVEEFKTEEGRTFQIYICESSTANFQKYHARLESFIFWYIDASSRIDHDERWRFFVVYEKFETSESETRYASVGYASVYLYFHYPDKVRPRVSQFLILPPFQRKGIGSKLLQKVYKHFQSQDDVCDITVEDASEDFQRLRNTIDARMLKDLPSFSAENLKQGFGSPMAHEAKDKFKINPKQSRIIYEILRLGATETSDKADYKSYRLDVKKRLNMNYLKEKRDMKKLVERGFKMPADKKLAMPSVEENIEQLDGIYKETEEYYKSVLERI